MVLHLEVATEALPVQQSLRGPISICRVIDREQDLLLRFTSASLDMISLTTASPSGTLAEIIKGDHPLSS
jgi:hypothetical protein